MPQSQNGTPSVGWIKFLAIVTAWLTIILVALIIVLGMFVWRLEVLTDSLVASRRSAQLSSPTAEQSCHLLLLRWQCLLPSQRPLSFAVEKRRIQQNKPGLPPLLPRSSPSSSTRREKLAISAPTKAANPTF